MFHEKMGSEPLLWGSQPQSRSPNKAPMPPLPLKQFLLKPSLEGGARQTASPHARQQPDPFAGEDLTQRFKSTEVTLLRKRPGWIYFN